MIRVRRRIWLRSYGVDVPFMQLERRGWDIHAVKFRRAKPQTGTRVRYGSGGAENGCLWGREGRHRRERRHRRGWVASLCGGCGWCTPALGDLRY